MLGACALVAALVVAAPASAQDEGFATSSVTQDQYGDRADQFSGAGGDPSTDPSTSVGSLPFTGLDLALMGGAAATLLAGGVLMRRRPRRLDRGEES